MYKIFYFLAILFVSYVEGHTVTADDCKQKEDTKCTAKLGDPVWKPHSARYVYDWDQKKCRMVLWAYDCPHANHVNNFGSKEECQAECGGWA